MRIAIGLSMARHATLVTCPARSMPTTVHLRRRSRTPGDGISRPTPRSSLGSRAAIARSTAATTRWRTSRLSSARSSNSPPSTASTISAPWSPPRFYHDAVYEPASPANERASARLARRDLATLGWAQDRIAHVARMIEATTDHRAPPDQDHAVLFDADLMILGAAPADYASYVDAVRAEYRHVDDDAWRTGVAATSSTPSSHVRRSTRRRRGTPGGRHAARQNLTAELAALTG